MKRLKKNVSGFVAALRQSKGSITEPREYSKKASFAYTQEDYLIEAIKGSKVEKGVELVLIKWHDTWEPASSLK